jgi:hypothetical protein
VGSSKYAYFRSSVIIQEIQGHPIKVDDSISFVNRTMGLNSNHLDLVVATTSFCFVFCFIARPSSTCDIYIRYNKQYTINGSVDIV